MNAAIIPPRLSVAIDGTPIGLHAARALTSIWVMQAVNAPALAELVFVDALTTTVAVLRPGAAMTISVGREPMFAGAIAEVETAIGGTGERELRIRAHDPLRTLAHRHHPRMLTDTTVGDLVKEAADALRLDAAIDAAGPVRRRRVQTNQTDLEFLVDAVQRAGLWLVVDDIRLRLMRPEGYGDAITLAAGSTLFQARRTDAPRLRRGCTATGWSPGSSATFRASVAGEGRHMLGTVAESSEEVEARAHGDVARAAASAAQLSGTAEGNAKLRPGARIRITAAGQPLDGAYVLSRAHHRIAPETGYIVEFSTDPATAAPERGTSVALGRVIDLDDPERGLRVRVALDAADGLESDWMPLLAAGAGANSGAIAFPALDDAVLVLLPDSDIARGIVLGGLYAQHAPPTFDGAAGPCAIAMRTRGGQSLFLGSDTATARIETSSGGLLEMSSDGTRLTAHGDIMIEAPGRTITLRARAIDFEQG